jgi:hypothetical protein
MSHVAVVVLTRKSARRVSNATAIIEELSGLRSVPAATAPTSRQGRRSAAGSAPVVVVVGVVVGLTRLLVLGSCSMAQTAPALAAGLVTPLAYARPVIACNIER